jgi:hypothetical protein
VVRFEREARFAAQLRSPFAVRTYDVLETDRHRCIVMEFVEGESLERILAREGRLGERRALRIVRDVATALHEAHERDIVHRDIKPGNILIATDGTPKVADLGLAKSVGPHDADLTSHDAILGTASYMSPEQAQGATKLDRRCDVFSLGATLYRMVVGGVPFAGDTPLSVIHRIASEPVSDPQKRAPDLSPQVVAIIRRMMALDRADRYATMADVIADIDAFLALHAPDARTDAAASAALLVAPSSESGSPARDAWHDATTVRSLQPRDRLRRALLAGGAIAVLALLPYLIARGLDGPVFDWANGPAGTGPRGRGPALTEPAGAVSAPARRAATTAPAGPTETGPVLFADDFANEADRWTFFGGSWAVESGALVQTNRSSDYHYATAGDSSWTDYELSVDVRSEVANKHVGIMVRAPEGPVLGGVSEFGKCILQSHPNGGVTLNAGGRTWNFNFNWRTRRTYRMRIRVVGQRLTCWIDGRRLVHATVPDEHLSRAGRIGLYSYGDRSTFDNVEVRGILSKP